MEYLNNTPEAVLTYIAFIDSTLKLNTRFPAGFDLSRVSVKLFRSSEQIQDNYKTPKIYASSGVFTAELNPSQLKLLPSAFNVTYYIDKVAKFVITVNTTADPTLASTESFNVLLKNDDIVLEVVLNIVEKGEPGTNGREIVSGTADGNRHMVLNFNEGDPVVIDLGLSQLLTETVAAKNTAVAAAGTALDQEAVLIPLFNQVTEVSNEALERHEELGAVQQTILADVEVVETNKQLVVSKAAEASTSAQTATNKATEAGTFSGESLAQRQAAEQAKIDTLALKNQTADLRTATEILKIAAETAVTQSSVYKGLWDASTNTPALSSTVPAAGFWYEIGKTGTQNITGTAVLYEEGQKIISNGTSWELSKGGLIPANGTVSPAKLIPRLQDLVNELPAESPYMFIITDALNRIGFGIKKDGTIEGKFIINAINMMAESVNTAALQAKSVNRTKLADEVANIIPGEFNSDFYEYAYVLLDASSRIALGIKKDGTVIGKFQLPDSAVTALQLATAAVTSTKIGDSAVTASKIATGAVTASKIPDASITLAKLAAEVTSAFPNPFDPTDHDYVYLVLDSSNRIGFGIKKDGTIVGKFSVPDNSITSNKLHPDLLAQIAAVTVPAPLLRLNSANPNDVEVDFEDDWREDIFTVPVKTLPLGYSFSRFGPAMTKNLRGLNNTGVALQFRQSNRLNLKGRRYRGTFNPIASGVVGTNFRGRYGSFYSNSYPAFSTGNPGDFWIMDGNPSGASITANGLTFKNGDLVVLVSTGVYAIQAGPGDGVYVEGDFWTVTANGRFFRNDLLVNQRYVYIGLSTGGGPKNVESTVSKTGEFYLMGECNPSSFTPVTPIDGDCYLCSAAGTTLGLSMLEGDMLAYEGGWFVIPGNMKNVAAGAAVFLPCTNSVEWEVRRTDKSNTQVILNLTGSRAMVRRKVSDGVRLLSDSMFGAGGLGSKIVAAFTAAGRTSNFRSNGGAKSRDILALLKLDIRTGDLYAGMNYVIWHGQNNSSANIEETQTGALQMASILGAEQKRFIFWTILGSRGYSWNGTRLVVPVQEQAFAGTNFVYQTEEWYKKAFPKQWWSPRIACLELAVGRNIPDITFPGMTEAQVAATYGVVPYSFFFDYSTKPFTAADLIFDGYWNTTSLPLVENGVNNHYYLRSGGGSMGAPIVFTGGAWVEYDVDIIHVTQECGTLLSAKFVSYYNSLNL